MDFNNYEQWAAEGAKDAEARATAKAKSLLATYEEPKLDEGKHEALREFMTRRERELPDNVS
jgi:trimethylamine---corrinoid protein Co-methyltransferase